jgi:hypothetical protein
MIIQLFLTFLNIFKMKKAIFKLFLIGSFVSTFASCANRFFVIDYKAAQLTEQEAKTYIEEMYFAKAFYYDPWYWWREGRSPNKFEITNTAIMAGYDNVITTENRYRFSSSSNVVSNLEILYFKQIESIILKRETEHTKHKVYVVVVKTRSGEYTQICNSETLAKNYIDALEYFKRKAKTN